MSKKAGRTGAVPGFLNVGFLNLMLRVLTLASRFFLVIFIADKMTLEDLGYYGLISAIVVFALQIIGFDFYVFNKREILGKRGKHFVQFIRDQSIFHLCTYLIAVPALLLAFSYAASFDWHFVVVLVLLVVTEHISQEMSRLFVTLKRPLFSNFIIFIRSGLWVWGFIALGVLAPEKLDLQILITFWAVGGLASLVVGGTVLLRQLRANHVPVGKVDGQWIRGGLQVATPFFISTLFLKLLELSDRFFIDAYMTKADLGVYVFSQNMANTLNTLINTGVVAIVAPKLISAFMNDRAQEYSAYNRQLRAGIVFGGLAAMVVIAVAYPVVVDFTGKHEVAEQLEVFYLLIVAVFMGLLALLPYYGLYVRNMDRQLMLSVGVAALVNIALNAYLVPVHGLTGAAISSLLAFATMFIMRLACLRTSR